LGIDAPYGRGKTWFITRLAKQLALSHPVAFVDAWADDVGDEPLSAFVSAIDKALDPYVNKSKKLGDRVAAAKAASLPVIGKLVSGALTKALTKVAGDEIEEQLGIAIEQASKQSSEDSSPSEEGAASQAMDAALEVLAKEIDSLVDRQGAAMLASFRQKQSSREFFKETMKALVATIDESDGPGVSPLIVVVDELDRCRPSYAIKVLEEIKHFFEIPGVVFIIGLHGDQLSRSVRAVYGSEFDSDDYLRRFFTRTYVLREESVMDLASAICDEWQIDGEGLRFPDISQPSIGDDPPSVGQLIGLILTELEATPREVISVMDGLRLFLSGWEHPEPAEAIAILHLLLCLCRGQPLGYSCERVRGDLAFQGTAWSPDQSHGNPSSFSLKQYIDEVRGISKHRIGEVVRGGLSTNPAVNFVRDGIQHELVSRRARKDGNQGSRPLLATYVDRVHELGRFA